MLTLATIKNHLRKTPALEGYYLLAFLFLSIFFLEIVLRVSTGSEFFNDGLLHSYLFAGATAAIIHFGVSLLPRRTETILLGLLLLIITLLFGSQLIYHKIFLTFYTVFSAGNGAQVLEFLPDILRVTAGNSAWLLVLFIPFILILRPDRPHSAQRTIWKERVFSLVLAAVLWGTALVTLRQGDRDVNSAYDVYYRNPYPVASVNRLGLLTSMRLDLQRSLTGFVPPAPPPLAEVTRPSGPAEPAAPAHEVPDPPDPVTVPAEQPVIYEDQVMAIDFDRLIDLTGDEGLKDTHRYFRGRTPTKKNAHTGLFEGYNLILITAESFSHYAIDEELTPTLWKMSREGFRFPDFYNPVWSVSTSDGEYVATTGLIPKNGIWSMYKSGSNSMPFAMGNQLRRLNYKTLAFHNHTFDYYRRDVSHPNLGYDYKGLGSGLEVRPTWPESDVEMMELTVDDYIDQPPFHTYYMTVSGHMDYNFDGNFISSKNRALVKDLPYLEAGRAYLATQIELDRALEYLLEQLEDKGMAETTLFAISSDHYPYGLSKEELDDLAGHPVEENFELYRSSFLLYAKGMVPETIDHPVCSMDIIPTLSNLMGLEYDSRLLMGTDIFSDSPPLVVFNNRSFITDLGRFDSVKRTFTLNPGVTMTEAEADSYRRSISEEIDRQFYYSARILDLDYYSLVISR